MSLASTMSQSPYFREGRYLIINSAGVGISPHGVNSLFFA